MIKFRPRVALAGLAVLAMIGAACSNDTSTSAAAPSGGSGTGVCASADTTTGDALAEVCSSAAAPHRDRPEVQAAIVVRRTDQHLERFRRRGRDRDRKPARRARRPSSLKWNTITAGSWNDRWDVSVGSMTDTVDRESLFYFTPAYYYTPAAISVFQDNTTINGPADLTGKTVCVGVSTTYQDYVEGDLVLGAAAPPFKFEINDGNLQTFDTDTDALDNLALGDGVRCDAAISAQQTIQAFIDDGGPIKLVGDSLYYEPLAIAFDKNDPADAQSLSEAVSQIVDDMHADGTLSELSKKWYSGVDWTTASAGAAPSSTPS